MVKMVFRNIHSIHFRLLGFFIVHHLHSDDYHKALGVLNQKPTGSHHVHYKDLSLILV